MQKLLKAFWGDDAVVYWFLVWSVIAGFDGFVMGLIVELGCACGKVVINRGNKSLPVRLRSLDWA